MYEFIIILRKRIDCIYLELFQLTVVYGNNISQVTTTNIHLCVSVLTEALRCFDQCSSSLYAHRSLVTFYSILFHGSVIHRCTSAKRACCTPQLWSLQCGQKIHKHLMIQPAMPSLRMSPFFDIKPKKVNLIPCPWQFQYLSTYICFVFCIRQEQILNFYPMMYSLV